MTLSCLNASTWDRPGSTRTAGAARLRESAAWAGATDGRATVAKDSTG